MIKIDQNHELHLKEDEAFYAKRDHEPSGQAPSIQIPNPLQGLVPRIIYNAFMMNAYTGPKGGGTIRFMGPDARRYVAWTLGPGDAVCFSYKKLVGFSSTVQLSTEISLRLSAFAMNWLLYPIATGPGILLMQCAGKPVVIDDGSISESQPPSRLVCWSAETVFELEAKSGFVNDYLSPVYVKPIQSKAVVIEADEQDRSTPGLLDRLMRFAFPRS